MCGIVGFTGREQAAPILLDGLSNLGKGLDVDKPRNLAKSVTVE